MKQLEKIALLLIIAVGVQACYPGGSIPIEDLDTASTFYNPDDFTPSPPSSAAIIWEVAVLESGDDSDLDYDGEVDDEILNTTLENLVSLYGVDNVTIIGQRNALGNLAGPTPSNQNVTVLLYETGGANNPPFPIVEASYSPSIKLTRNTVGVIHPGYPWYPGWGGGWWGGGCYYCGYPPTVSYQTFDVGSIIIDLHDLRQIDNGQVPSDFDPSWVALVKGLISSNSTSNSSRVVNNIDQSFEQSPYLK